MKTYLFKARSARSLTALRQSIRSGWGEPTIILRALPNDDSAIADARKLVNEQPGPAASCAVKHRNSNVMLGWWLKGLDGEIRWEPWTND